MVSFAEGREEWLRKFIELPGDIPSHDTFGEIFSKINPEEFHKAFIIG